MTTQDKTTDVDVPEELRLDARPELMLHTVEIKGPDGVITTESVYGRLLGTFANGQDNHENHPGEYALARFQCFACRWTEVSIYDTRDDPNVKHVYVVQTIGRSDVPGEVDYVRSTTDARNGFMIVEALISKYRGGANLSHAAKMALAEASAYDLSIRQAWRITLNDTAVGHRGN